MWVSKSVSRQLVFSAAEVWRVARAALSNEFPGFGIVVARRETPGRFAGGGLGAGPMLVVHDKDGYELDYGERLLLDACIRHARELGNDVPAGAEAQLRIDSLDPYVGQALPDDDALPVVVIDLPAKKDDSSPEVGELVAH